MYVCTFVYINIMYRIYLFLSQSVAVKLEHLNEEKRKKAYCVKTDKKIHFISTLHKDFSIFFSCVLILFMLFSFT